MSIYKGTNKLQDFPLGTTSVNKVYKGSTPVFARMNLNFDENGGGAVSNKTVYYGDTYGTLPATSRTGYTFNGWFTNESWTTKITSGTIVSEVDDHTLYAKLDINYYTVTWKDWDGEILETQSVAYGTTPTAPSGTPNTAQYNYSWPTISSVTGAITYQETRALQYYTITFRNYQNSVLDTQYLAYGATPVPPSGTPDTTQYDYYWPTISSVTAATTYQETRKLQQYTVTWKDWDGTTLKTQSVDYGGNGTPPTQPTRTGYTFISWNGTYTNVTSNRTITAKYDINYYSVTFKDYDGTTLKTQSVAYGSNATPPTQPTRTGYTFNSWSGTYTNITSSRIITATYDINYYTVTWKNWNNTTLKTESVAYGGNGTPPTQPTRTGYTFSNWSGDYTGITGNVTIIANYTVNSYTLTKSTITGLSNHTVTRTTSPNAGASLTTLGNGATIYYGDTLTIVATASSGYSASVSGSPLTVTGNVTTSSYITVTYDVSQPIITYTGKSPFSVSFTVKNQVTQYSVRIYYKAGSAPTTSSYDGYVDVAANTTSPTQTLDGLVPSTSYNIYARAYKSGSYSSSVYFNQTTSNLSAPSTWSDNSRTTDSITMRVYNPNTEAVTLYYAANQNPPTANSITVPAQSYAYATISGLSANTTYTIYGRFAYSGKYSTTVSDSATTDAAGVATEWTYLGTSYVSYQVDASSIGIGKCPSSTQARNNLTNSHPPQNYSPGTVARVQCYANGNFPPPPICATFYYEATVTATEYIIPIDSDILAEYGNDNVLDGDLSNQEIYINDGGWIQVWDGSTTHAGVSINFANYNTLRQAINANYFLYWYGDDWIEDYNGLYVMNFDFKIIG